MSQVRCLKQTTIYAFAAAANRKTRPFATGLTANSDMPKNAFYCDNLILNIATDFSKRKQQ